MAIRSKGNGLHVMIKKCYLSLDVEILHLHEVIRVEDAHSLNFRSVVLHLMNATRCLR